MRSYHKTRIISFLLFGLVLFGSMAGAVYAYLSAISGPAGDTLFPAPETDPVIATSSPVAESIADNLFVSVGDIGYPVYVRAAIVITWEDPSGAVYGQLPAEGQDYAISLNVGADGGWFLGSDGFYYHKARVPSSGQSAPLIYSLTPLDNAATPQGYTLHVQLVSQSIQAIGTTDANDIPAVQDAWKVVTIDRGTLELIPYSDP